MQTDTSSIPVATSTCRRPLGAHHFAHLRAVAEGVPIAESAMRYLGVEHGNAAAAAHRAVVERLRAVARRSGDRRWRLIGLSIRAGEPGARPSLEDWSAENGLAEWSEAELVELYEEAFPLDRRSARNQRLRARQLKVLRDLERSAAELPRPQDPIAAWFDPELAERLRGSGLLLLQDLQQLVAPGGRWWRSLPAIGPVKAGRIAAYLNQLLPPLGAAPQDFGLQALAVGAQGGTPLRLPPRMPAAAQAPATGLNRAPAAAAGIAASTDAEAIEAWVAARAGSAATARIYRREAERLRLWAMLEHGKSLSDLLAEDCLAYMTFLQYIPERWISRRRAKPMQPGWAPFAGQLSLASRRQAVVIVAGLFSWLVDAGYLIRNPWTLVNRRTGDDAEMHALDSRAFEPEVWTKLLGWIESQPPSASRSRVLFVLRFTEATGLRAGELVAARLGDLRLVRGRWAMQVHGKGARNRIAAVPRQAVQALDDYLQSRGLPLLADAPAHVPLLASLTDSMQAIGYQALYETVRSWLRRALRGVDLPEALRRVAARASVHWLRHTCGTRALERGTALEVVQRQLGHADPRTTMRYAKAQLERLQDGMEKAFGG